MPKEYWTLNDFKKIVRRKGDDLSWEYDIKGRRERAIQVFSWMLENPEAVLLAKYIGKVFNLFLKPRLF